MNMMHPLGKLPCQRTLRQLSHMSLRTGVNVYVLDTGVYTDHQDFEGRAKHSANFVEYEKDGDMGGHGTRARSFQLYLLTVLLFQTR